MAKVGRIGSVVVLRGYVKMVTQSFSPIPSPIPQTRTHAQQAAGPYVKYIMRILVTLPPDSSQLVDIALYCAQHHIELRRESWRLDQRDFEFHLIYTDDSAHVHWLYLTYPCCFFEF